MSVELEGPKGKWGGEYDLVASRQRRDRKAPARHQAQALAELRPWYFDESPGDKGAILVLPTGAGKTFTAVSFLCEFPITQGRKVLWLAHSHHLLEQASRAFEDALPLIGGPKSTLVVRVVSGGVGHCKIHQITPEDDVVICSLQAAALAFNNDNSSALESFVDASGDDLFVVFDEAHHSPAPSYWKLIRKLRTRSRRMKLLGLTATPVYSDKSKSGRLNALFPQWTVSTTTAAELMAANVLSRPIIEDAHTNVEQEEIDQQTYRQMLTTYRDLPESIIEQLASNEQRNNRIVSHYLANRERYGKTIIFADRWYQCEYLREGLLKAGVRAAAMYSHVDSRNGDLRFQRQRAANENDVVLERFRRGELDVLINVRMLTEGTDVPSVQTVFLTRQTTSQILLTQMVGRALRGPAFGGTPDANIVSFIDNWKQHIRWARFDAPDGVPDDGDDPHNRPRLPVQYVSIELIRRLARERVQQGPASKYIQHLPLGWYQCEYHAVVSADGTNSPSDDDLPQRELVLVFEGQQASFERLFDSLGETDLTLFAEPSLDEDDEDVVEFVSAWRAEFFANDVLVGDTLDDDLCAVARHMAQNEGEPPAFFPFEARNDHDLDRIANEFIEKDLGAVAIRERLHQEFHREDRFWAALYYHFHQFEEHADICKRRLMNERFKTPGKPSALPPAKPHELPDLLVPESVRNELFQRDGNRCVCCGSTFMLTVDHVSPSSLHGPNHELSNLQTLCGSCNSIKGKSLVDFRKTATPLVEPLQKLPQPKMPSGPNVCNTLRWQQYLRRVVNQFYRCSAVESVVVRLDAGVDPQWTVTLRLGINSTWLNRHLPDLARRIREAMELEGARGPDVIEVVGGSPAEERSPPSIATSSIDAIACVAGDLTSTDNSHSSGTSIFDMDQNERMAVVRSAFASGLLRDREQAIRDVAAQLRCKRLGPNIRKAIENAILAAQLRGVLQNDNGQYSLLTRSVNDYTTDALVDTLMSAIGNGWLTRYDAMVAGARHLGYRRTGKDIQGAFKSAINAAIRRGFLERDGADYVRRTR